MQKYLFRNQKYNKQIYCLYSFKLIVFLSNEQEEREFKWIIERFENEREMKMYNVCYWLSGRKIKYSVSFRYVLQNGIKWNLIKYRDYLRLKIRLNELQKL